LWLLGLVVLFEADSSGLLVVQLTSSIPEKEEDQQQSMQDYAFV